MFRITQPNIINVAELRAVITEAMAELPSDLERHRSGIQACLTRAAAMHNSVRSARRRQGDPAWAQVANYTEWSNAVRIDLSTRAHALDLFAERETVQLALSFATQHSCVDQILSGDDPRGAIKRFGRKKLRRIVSQIALSQVAPSMVQHRLLALSA